LWTTQEQRKNNNKNGRNIMDNKKVTRDEVKKLTAPMRNKVKITTVKVGSSGPTTFSTSMISSAAKTNFTPGRISTRDNRFVNNKDYGFIGGKGQ
jgi:hypothetical protein